MKRADEASKSRVVRNLAKLGLKPAESNEPTFAYVSDGRWVAECRDDACSGAELVREGQAMLCGSCGSVSQVIWPADVTAIETLLMRRKPRNRHWLLGETLEQLQLENQIGGVS